MNTTKIENNKINALKNEICDDFYKSCKSKNNIKVGLEIERLPVYKKSYMAASYFGSNGMYRLLRQIAYNDEWRYIADLTFINGLKKDETTITLEPGGQIEYSIRPQKSLLDLKNEVDFLDSKIVSIADSLGISLLEYPITPLTSGLDIEIIPKRRYQTMAKYMKGERCFSMMRETAGIQVAMDYTDENDAMKKYKIAMMLSPFATAMFANSPIRCGKITGYKSTRALAWLKTDEQRCGFVSDKLFKHDEFFSFEDYVDAVMKVPVLFVQRDDKIIEFGGKFNFYEFLNNDCLGIEAKRTDYDLHSTLFFPEVRLKNIIEIRNQDTQFGDMKYAIPALYKGILYNTEMLNEVFELLKDITYDEYKKLRLDTPKYALNTKIGKKKVLDYAKIICDISFRGLKKLNQNEEYLLEPIIELVSDGLCPADILIKNWYKSNRSVKNLVESVVLK